MYGQETTQQTDKNYAEILLELGPDDSINEVKPILKKYKATYRKTFVKMTLQKDENLAQYYTVKVIAEQANALIKELKQDYENVDNAELNTSIQLEKPLPFNQVLKAENNEFIANDPKLNEQWALYNYQINEIHDLLKKIKPKKKAKVAILDTGVDANHEDLTGIFKKAPADKDRHGHGTHCAGIAGANTNNKSGIASLNWGGTFIEILGFAALDGSGRGTVESVAQSIIDAADSGADVLSLSLGGWHPVPPKAEVDAINYALKKSCVVIVAAGNDNEDAKEHSPANIEGVICVAAIDQNGKKAYFSNTNTSLKHPIAAPGVDILSLKPNNEYVVMSGTSMATPLVAGLAGILRAINPDIPAKDVYLILEKTGIEGADKDKIGKTISPLSAIKAVSKQREN
jgi:thermitase